MENSNFIETLLKRHNVRLQARAAVWRVALQAVVGRPVQSN